MSQTLNNLLGQLLPVVRIHSSCNSYGEHLIMQVGLSKIDVRVDVLYEKEDMLVLFIEITVGSNIHRQAFVGTTKEVLTKTVQCITDHIGED